MSGASRKRLAELEAAMYQIDRNPPCPSCGGPFKSLRPRVWAGSQSDLDRCSDCGRRLLVAAGRPLEARKLIFLEGGAGL